MLARSSTSSKPRYDIFVGRIQHSDGPLTGISVLQGLQLLDMQPRSDSEQIRLLQQDLKLKLEQHSAKCSSLAEHFEALRLPQASLVREQSVSGLKVNESSPLSVVV